MSQSNRTTLLPLYTPSPGRSMHVVVFGSGSGTNLDVILKNQRLLKNESGEPLFEVKALFTDRICRFHEIAEREGLPLIFHSFRAFAQAYGAESDQDPELRAAYDRLAVELIEACAKEYRFEVDLIFLAGYMRLVYPPILKRYKDRVLNIHPADLVSVTSSGRRKYIGAHAVIDALKEGERQTRSSVILVDEGIDTGPILVSGPWVQYTEGEPLNTKRAAYHQEKQKEESDWVATIQALSLIAEGRVSLDKQHHVYIDGQRQGPGGFLMQNES